MFLTCFLFLCRLFTFPTKRYDVEKREKWKQLVGRQDGKKLWSPPKDSRVCSEHFLDGKPTPTNPLPMLKLGYAGAEGRVKRMSMFPDSNRPRKKRMIVIPAPALDMDKEIEMPSTDPNIETLIKEVPRVPWILCFCSLFMCVVLMVVQYRKKISKLSEENTRLKREISKLKAKVYSETMLQSDEDVSFYTGLPSKSLFDKLHSFISPYVNRRWTGVKT